ncbi:UDP-N-acetylglucosamine/UDP-glucose/GDP-mannose transporter [Nymphon striatum]|nr:UDP-N-acetylglucosamine/UDP-glucose/GDP-mannose transporter [Nymphon striatum]
MSSEALETQVSYQDSVKQKETAVDIVVRERLNEGNDTDSNMIGRRWFIHSERFLGMLTALFYAFSSASIMMVNKHILTTMRFPSAQVLGIGQMLATIILLHFAKKFKFITYPNLTTATPFQIWPLPLFYIGNLICGLSGTKSLNLPMFIVLRRFTILMTLIGELVILKKIAKFSTIASVIGMVFGAIVAAALQDYEGMEKTVASEAVLRYNIELEDDAAVPPLPENGGYHHDCYQRYTRKSTTPTRINPQEDDITFDAVGYTYVLLNDVMTTANGIYSKKKLESKELGKYGLLFYNCLFMIIPASIFALFTEDINKIISYENWGDFGFQVLAFLGCIMGFVLMYATLLCTAYNSALTTTIIGSLKNVFITYFGILIGNDYIFSITNFCGLTISAISSIGYGYLTFFKRPSST